MEDFASLHWFLTYGLRRSYYRFLWDQAPDDFRQAVALGILRQGFRGAYRACVACLRELARNLGWHYMRLGDGRAWVGDLEWILTPRKPAGPRPGKRVARPRRGKRKWLERPAPADGKRGGLEL